MEMNRGRSTPDEPDGIPAPASNLRRRRRAAWNPATWTPVTASFASNRTYRAPGTAGGRGFAPTEHLAAEAIAAFVDGELGMTAHLRASQHLALCAECMNEVDAQVSARARLRSAGDVSLPAGLLGQLSQIPTREIDISDTPGFPLAEVPDPAGHPETADDRQNPRGLMNRWRGR